MLSQLQLRARSRPEQANEAAVFSTFKSALRAAIYVISGEMVYATTTAIAILNFTLLVQEKRFSKGECRLA
jgi:hypothetical protein